MTSWGFASPIPERQPQSRLSQLFDHLPYESCSGQWQEKQYDMSLSPAVCMYWVLVNRNDRETSLTLKLQLLARGRQRHFFIKSTDTRCDNHPACRFPLTVVRLAHANQGSY